MPGEHRCSQCHSSFPYQSALQRHMEIHMITGDWLCGLCNTLCLRLPALIKHWRITCTEFKQVYCDDDRKAMSNDEIREAAYRLTLARYSSESQLDYAEPASSNQVAYEDRTISSLCIYCSLHMPDGTLPTHYGVHSNQNVPGERTLSSKVPYVCDLCGFGFRFKKSLYNHWRYRCWELLAHCPPHGMTIDNRGLVKMVGDLVRHSEVVAPYEVTGNGRDEEAEKQYESLEDEDGDEETHPSFTAHLSPLTAEDHHCWNVENNQNPRSCHRCNKRFHSHGRMQLHLNAFHDGRRPFIECELCLIRFTENRNLIHHLRTNCRAMKIEEPNDAKRKNLSSMDLLSYVDTARNRWRALFQKKKIENIKNITEYVNNIDKQIRQMEEKPVPVLEIPVPKDSFLESPTDNTICGPCKIKFSSSRFLYQHQLAVHKNQPPQNQVTITTSSLLPYFKQEQAVFYDSTGGEYRMGKLLEKGIDFAKILKNRIITPGSRIDNIEENDSFVVQLFGKDSRHVLLNQQEIASVCGVDARLKSLFIDNPKELDDIPLLTKETFRV